MTWQEVTLFGLAAGVIGSGAGGAAAYFVPRLSERLMGTILGLSAGVMLAVVFMELIPEGISITGFPFLLIGLILGVLVFLLLDNYLPHDHFFSSEKKNLSFLKKGVLLAIGIALHNLPEGLAIGVGFAASSSLGITLAILIALHNFPEGMAVAFPLIYSGLKRQTALTITLLTGIPMGIGAFFGAIFGAISPLTLGISLGFAAGAMLYIICDELLPDAYQTAGSHLSILGITAGVILGVIIS